MVMGGQKRVSAPWLVLKIFGKWDEILSLEPEHQGTPYLDGIWSYVVGSAHIAKGNFDLAKIELDKLNSLANSPNADQYRVGATPASSVLKVAAHGLQGEFFSAKGEYIKAVKDAGKFDDTVFIVTSDHGDMQLEHRQFYKMVPYDASARVPMVIFDPRLRAEAPMIVEAPTQLVDLLPTILDFAKVPAPAWPPARRAPSRRRPPP